GFRGNRWCRRFRRGRRGRQHRLDRRWLWLSRGRTAGGADTAAGRDLFPGKEKTAMNLLIPILLLQFGDLSKVQIKTTKVAGSVSMLEGAGGNIGVSAGADGVFIIDDQFAPLAPKIKAALAQISKQPLRFIFNTHWHG